MTPRPANWPALVRLVKERIVACSTVSPASAAMIPKVKETARYPRPMGTPSRIPALYSFFLSLMVRKSSRQRNFR